VVKVAVVSIRVENSIRDPATKPIFTAKAWSRSCHRTTSNKQNDLS
jgi:hypothetical protein